MYDGVVKSPIYGVAGFLQTLYILHVLSRPCKKQCASESALPVYRTFFIAICEFGLDFLRDCQCIAGVH